MLRLQGMLGQVNRSNRLPCPWPQDGQSNIFKGDPMNYAHNTPEQNEAFRRAWDATNARWKAQQNQPVKDSK
jgi:hypothetical protein